MKIGTGVVATAVEGVTGNEGLRSLNLGTESEIDVGNQEKHVEEFRGAAVVVGG